MRWLILAAIALPFADLAALVALGQRLGGMFAFGYALLGVVIGFQLARLEGGRVMARAREALARGEAPGEGLAAGLALLVGGLLLALPGPISDALGLALFVGPVRRAVTVWLARRVGAAVAAGPGFGAMPFGVPRGAEPRTSATRRGPSVAGRGASARTGTRGAARARPGAGAVIDTEGEVVDEGRIAPRGDAPLPGGR